MLSSLSPANLKSILSKGSNQIVPKMFAMYEFPRKVAIEFSRGHYLVKTVSTMLEYWQARRLRYEVFHREFSGKRLPIGFDNDPFDNLGDILIIVDKRSRKLIGTYRLLSSHFTEDFYSATEFDIQAALDLPGAKLELSRACIHREYRTGIVISLLWKGLSEYIQKTQSHYLFGCSSLPTLDSTEVAHAFWTLRQAGQFDEKLNISVLPKFDPGQDFADAEALLAKQPPSAPYPLPALLRSYLRAGALISGQPALDKKFRCHDLFTLLPYKNLTQSYKRKYN